MASNRLNREDPPVCDENVSRAPFPPFLWGIGITSFCFSKRYNTARSFQQMRVSVPGGK